MDDFEIFLTAPPGLEQALLGEVREAGFAGAEAVPGGVTCQGGWPEVWRANLTLRGAGRVLAASGCPAAVQRQVAWDDLVLTFTEERFVGWRRGDAAAGQVCV